MNEQEEKWLTGFTEGDAHNKKYWEKRKQIRAYIREHPEILEHHAKSPQ